MQWLRRIIEHPSTERVVMTLIVVNAVTLGLETSQPVMARWGGLLHVLDQAILAVFVIELLGRMALQRAAFFRDGWNVFDFVVIGVSLAPATDAFTVLRALRVLRLLRLITVVPSLRRVVGAGRAARRPRVPARSRPRGGAEPRCRGRHGRGGLGHRRRRHAPCPRRRIGRGFAHPGSR